MKVKTKTMAVSFGKSTLQINSKTMAPKTSPELFPSLPLKNWEETKDTFHLFLQIVGKIRLGLMPRKNHWWHATLFVTPTGITTEAMPYQNRTLELQFDLQNHRFLITVSDGQSREFVLRNGLSVAEFYHLVFDNLKSLGIDLKILAKPYDNKSKIPFAKDHEHRHYDQEKVHKFWLVLSQVDQLLKEFSGRFYGKTCPVQIYWHHMDLTVTRFSGKKVPINPEASIVEKDAYSHEVISFGFWAGDDVVREPAFYSYTYPLPAKIDQEKLEPTVAKWVESNGSPMAYLSYEELRKEPDPKKALLDFLESAYQAGANLANWPVEEWKVPALTEL